MYTFVCKVGVKEKLIDLLVVWTPYFASVLDAWGKRNHPNLLILFYEDMIKVYNEAIFSVWLLLRLCA